MRRIGIIPSGLLYRMMTSPVVLEARGLRKEFGALRAVNDVTLEIRAQTFHSIIGPNGAGKTTLFNLLSGTLEPTSGQVLFNGQDITHAPVHRRAHLGLGRSYQITNIFPNLTVLENVRLAVQALGSDNFKFWSANAKFARYTERARQVLEQVGLSDRSLRLARTLPQGDQRKLELGMILAPAPEILLLDEPTSGMATEQIPELIGLIQTIQRESRKTVVLVEHNMDVVMSVSDTITVMHQGSVLAEGAPAAIAANVQVQDAYLGHSLWHDALQQAQHEQSARGS